MVESLERKRLVAPSIDHLTAALAAVAIGTHEPLLGPVTISLLVPLALIPVWLPRLAPLKEKIIPLLAVGAIFGGFILNAWMAPTHRIANSVTIAQTALILEVALGAGTLIWCRLTMGSAPTALLFGVGLLAGRVAHGLSPENPWKLDLFLPITIIALAFCWWLRNFVGEIMVLAVLILISALNDSRSAASILATTLLILVWQRVRTALRVRSTPVRVATGLAFIGAITYFVMQAFILEGFFGENTRERSEAQIRSAGSLLLGGRPELGATVALLRANPWGYGMGTVPNASDINVAKTGMEALNYNPNNGYVERYMFGGGIEVHSVIGDLWLRCGLLGLAFALSIVIVVLQGALRRLANDRGGALTTLLAIQVLWDALFSPFYITAAQVIILALGLLAATPRTREGAIAEPLLGETKKLY